MTKPKKGTNIPKMPAECCGVCKFAQMVENDLYCFGLPPQMVMEVDTGEMVYMRGASIEPTDEICALFQPRQMA